MSEKSANATPAMVFMNIGKNEAYIINAIFDSSPTPNHIKNNVVRAIAGTKRKKLSIGSINHFIGLNVPTIKPNGTPSTTADSHPFNTRKRLATISLCNV